MSEQSERIAQAKAEGWNAGYRDGHRQACPGACTHGVMRNPYGAAAPNRSTSGEIAALAEVLRGIGFIGTHADFGSLTGDDDAKRRWTAEQIVRAWT